MEVGAVKQAFNNEVIQLKRNFNQAKIQIIHKLTRKAKTFTEKKGPDKLKEKLKRKAESAVKEVLIMKKIKPKVLAKFAVTHTGNLQDYLNKPIVDQDKACARLLLHKSLQEKYNYIRTTFSNIPISDLLMSRLERQKMKKEALEKQKMKRDKKRKVVNAEGEWEVENLKTVTNSHKKILEEDEVSGDDDNMGSDADSNSGEERDHSDNEEKSESDEEQNDDSDEEVGETMQTDEESDHEKDLPEEGSEDDQDTNVGMFAISSPVKKALKTKIIPNDKQTRNANPIVAQLAKTKSKPGINKPTKPRDSNNEMETDEESDHEIESTDEKSDEGNEDRDLGKFVRPSPVKENVVLKNNSTEKLTKNANPAQPKNKNKPEIKKPIKPRDPNKNKKLNEKLISRNFKKDLTETQVKETKVVDPFFITSTGENYMSVAEPRQPDEVKEIHKQGNRQLRRAAMFGHAPKIKPRQNFKEGNFNRQNDSQGFRNNSYSGDGNYKRNEGQFHSRNDSQFRGRNDNQFRGRNDNQFKGRDDSQFKGNDKFRGGKDSQFKGNRNDSQFKGKNDSFRGRNDVERKEEKLHPSWEAKKKKSGLLPFQGKKIVFDES